MKSTSAPRCQPLHAHRTRTLRVHALALAAASLLGPWAATPADAASCNFLPATGNWAVLANWSCGVVPTAPANDSASILSGRSVIINDLDGASQLRSVLNLGNAGTVTLDAFGLNLASGGSSSNSGLIQVGGASTASLQISQALNNTGGVVNIGVGSALNQSSGSFSGGTINNAGTLSLHNAAALVGSSLQGLGVYQQVDGVGSTLSALSLAAGSSFAAGTNSTLTMNGAFNNAGSIATRATAGVGSTFSFNGDTSFNGTGSVVLNHSSNAVMRDDFGGRLVTVGAGQTLRGAGQVGAGTALRLSNAGTVAADVAGSVLSFNGGAVSNTGLIQASGGGQLNIGNVLLTNSGGSVQALAGSSVQLLHGGTIYGGTLTTVGNGVLRSADGVNARIGSGVTLSSGSTFLAGLNSTVFLGKGGSDSITNNGNIQTSASGGIGSTLSLDGALGLGGSGSITLQDANAAIRDDFGSRTLSLGAGQTLQGGGNVGAGTTLNLDNAGLITANQAGQALVLQMSQGVINTGTLRAESGGTLELIGSSFVRNSGALIESRAGSTVALGSNVTLYGGLLSGVGSFVQRDGVNTRLSGTQFGTLNGTNLPDALSIASGTTFVAGNNANLYIDGAIVNNGVLLTGAAGGTGSVYYVNTNGGVELSGSGRLTLQDVNAGVRDDFGGRVLTQAAGHTIEGYGGLGQGTTLLVNNAGLITANQNGRTLLMQTSQGVVNTGVVRAQDGGTLELGSSTGLRNVGGRIEALAGATFAMGSNATVYGGVLSGAGSYTQRDGVNSRLSGTEFGTLNSTNVPQVLTVDLGTTVSAGLNSNLYLDGAIVNKGVIRTGAAGTGTSSTLHVNTAGGAMLSGGGRITLQDANGQLRDDFGSRSFINGLDHTVDGYGQLGAGTTLIIDNRGLVTANVNGAVLTLQTSGAVANTGVLKAEAGGVLAITNTRVNNAGLITADAASGVVLSNATLVGGNLSSTGSGALRLADGSGNRITDVTLMADSQLVLGSGSVLNANGVNTNHGTVLMAGGAGSSSITVNTADGVQFGGNGVITLRGANDQIRDDFGGRSFTNGAGHSVQGWGQIGAGSTVKLSNDGIFHANSAGNTLLVNTSGGSITSGSGALRASDGGTLRFTTGTHTVQAGGVVEALANSTIQMDAAANFSNIAAGTLSAGVWIANAAGGSSALIDFQRNGTVVSSNAADVYLVGPGSVIQMRDAGGVVRSMDDTLSSNLGALRIQQGRVFTATANGGSFINGSGALLELSGGSFASNNLTLADAASTLVSFGDSAVNTANPVNGNGQVTVVNGSLSMARGFNLAPGSVVQVAAGATLNLGGATAASTVGRLNTSGALALGAQNLNVTKDYDNSQFGVGNAFNARANVSGSGQIVGVGASQTVTGAVAAAGANVWLLDLGKVRGGSSRTLSFQIANNGSGADIRGALQTTGLSDGRLSGSGTTAGNFGALAAGSSTGDYSVTFTASSGGALSGQSLNVASNFSNVATQTINLAGLATALAVGQATPLNNPVVLGNFRVGGAAPSQAFAVQNLTGGVGAEQLGINSVSSTGNFSGSNNLGAGFVAPGASFASAVTASVAGGVAGVNSGSLSIQYSTNGQLIDPGFITQAANSQTLALQATGYRVAGGLAVPAPVLLPAQRVGGALGVMLNISNTTVAGAYSEDLNASFSATSGAALATGSLSGLLAGNSNGSNLQLGVETTVSGVRSGTATVSYQTAGAVAGVSNGLAPASVGTQTVNVSGKVYAPAVAQVDTPAVNFGIVRVGDAVAARTVSVSNTASGALTDTLRASLAGGSPPFVAGGTVAALAAGASNNSGLSVSLNTGAAGVFNSNALISFTSQNPDMADLPLAGANVALTAQVNNLAASTLSKTGAGSFSGGALSYTLDLGTIGLGETGGTATLTLSNSANGPADALAGSFDLSALQAGDPFSLSGFGSFAGLAAGDSLGGLQIGFVGNTAGSFDRVLQINRLSTNGSGPDLTLASVQLHLQGTVVAVPEPGTWALWLGGLAAMVGLARRRLQRASTLSAHSARRLME